MLNLKQDHSTLVVLSVLADGPSYGYAITKAIASKSDGHFKLTASGMYPLLTKLEKQGLVSTSWEEVKAEGADPRRERAQAQVVHPEPQGTQATRQAHRSAPPDADAAQQLPHRE